MATARDAMVNLARTRVDALSLPLLRVLAGAQRQLFVCSCKRPLLKMIQRIVLILLASIIGFMVPETSATDLQPIAISPQRRTAATTTTQSENHK